MSIIIIPGCVQRHGGNWLRT